MLRSTALAKLILGAFVLYAPLCPCAALAANLAGESTEHQELSAAGHNSGYEADHARHGTAQSHDEIGHENGSGTTDDCHGSPADRADCSMSSADEADGEFAKTDRYGHSPVALSGYRYADAVASATIRQAGIDERTATRLPHDTPITSHDRLLT